MGWWGRGRRLLVCGHPGGGIGRGRRICLSLADHEAPAATDDPVDAPPRDATDPAISRSHPTRPARTAEMMLCGYSISSERKHCCGRQRGVKPECTHEL